MAGRPKGITASKEALAVVCLLKRLGWKYTEIGNIFGRHRDTIREWYNIGCRTIGSNLASILVKDRRLRIAYRGKSDDLSYINAKIHQNICGGGRMVKKAHHNSDWEDGENKEDY